MQSALATSTWVCIKDITEAGERDARKARAKIAWARRYNAKYNEATMDLDRERGAKTCAKLWNSAVDIDDVE